MKAAAYIRVSTDGQVGEERFGLEAQRSDVQAFADAHGIEVVEWFEDAGVSGATLDRPGLGALLAATAAGGFGAVLVAKMDRVARDLMAALWIEKELLKAGAEIVSVSEPFRGADPANVLFRQIIGAFAQFEKSRITERMSGGRKQKATRGGYAGGGVPMGYAAERGSKALTVDDDAARTVRRVFELRENAPAASLREIAEALNTEGFTTTTGRPFSKVQVKRVLDRADFYRGAYQYAGIEAPGKHAAIL